MAVVGQAVNKYVELCFNSSFILVLLWPPYVIGQAIIFLPCDFYLSFFLSSFFLA